MAHILIMGAGLGGVVMAYEMKDLLGLHDKLTVVTKDRSIISCRRIRGWR